MTITFIRLKVFVKTNLMITCSFSKNNFIFEQCKLNTDMYQDCVRAVSFTAEGMNLFLIVSLSACSISSIASFYVAWNSFHFQNKEE